MEEITAVGSAIKDLILTIAEYLTEDWTPGLVAGVLLASMVVFLAAWSFRVVRRTRAVSQFQRIFLGQKNADDGAVNFEELSAQIERNSKGRASRSLATAWGEYGETIIHYKGLARNSVRPSYFFNVDDLAFGPGFFRILPNLFVTIGLFFTFLGLIAALNTMTGKAIDDAAISELLSVASAKFIMSLTGLLCSIVFTVALRVGNGKIEGAVHALSGLIEDNLSFVSQEELAVRQLNIAEEQRDNLRTVGMELVSELTAQLKDGISGPIVESINDKMDEIVTRLQDGLPKALAEEIAGKLEGISKDIGRAGSDGLTDVVEGLSKTLTGNVTGALQDSGRHLSEAAAKIGELADRLDDSSGKMGSGMETAIQQMVLAVNDLSVSAADSTESTNKALSQGAEKLLGSMNETLEKISENTKEGSNAMLSAANEMKSAAEQFGLELKTATQSGAETAEATINEASAAAASKIQAAGASVTELVEEGRDEVLAPLNEMVSSLKTMTEELGSGAQKMQHMSESVGRGAGAVTEASDSFKAASNGLLAAAAPIEVSTSRIETATANLDRNVDATAQTVLKAAKQTAEIASETMERARDVLDGKRRGIEDALQGVQVVVREMTGQGNRLDDIDEKLGRAFETYNQKVEEALGSIKTYVSDVQGKFGEGIDQLQAVVDQAEDFTPQTRKAS
ncbi:hypothetical protein [Ruegeria atlantica]|uniref:hypothetical protein n=1 Tax=Ruegeria atlantica TaxID=81569 RepID=UPI002493F3B5|nr:hypothetical protein [Ruegeria atlantica]